MGTSAMSPVSSALGYSSDPASDFLSVTNPGQGIFGGPSSGNNMGGFNLDTIGKGVGIFGDLFGMYNQMQGLDLMKEQLGMQKTAYNNNATNQQNFTNGVINAFGSSQTPTNNQLV